MPCRRVLPCRLGHRDPVCLDQADRAQTDNGPIWTNLRHLVQQPLDLVSPHGRGLLIVDRVATAWGTVHEDGGKRVWFQLHAS